MLDKPTQSLYMRGAWVTRGKDMKQTRTKMASAMLAKLKAMQAINLAKTRQGGSGA